MRLADPSFPVPPRSFKIQKYLALCVPSSLSDPLSPPFPLLQCHSCLLRLDSIMDRWLLIVFHAPLAIYDLHFRGNIIRKHWILLAILIFLSRSQKAPWRIWPIWECIISNVVWMLDMRDIISCSCVRFSDVFAGARLHDILDDTLEDLSEGDSALP